MWNVTEEYIRRYVLRLAIGFLLFRNRKLSQGIGLGLELGLCASESSIADCRQRISGNRLSVACRRDRTIKILSNHICFWIKKLPPTTVKRNIIMLEIAVEDRPTHQMENGGRSECPQSFSSVESDDVNRFFSAGKRIRAECVNRPARTTGIRRTADTELTTGEPTNPLEQ